MHPEKILIVDDEALIRKSLRQMLLSKGYDAAVADSAAHARKVFQPGEYSLALIDLKLPDGSGIDLLREFREAQPDLIVIMMTAFGSIETAVEAMRLGAHDYVNKPFKSREIEVIVKLALGAGGVKREAKDEAEGEGTFSDMVGVGPEMAKIFQMVGKIVITPPEVPVLILGESGTGKEMVARAIHARSNRFDKPFVAINCAAIPANLLESELFGHERGAYTDAKQRKIGLFERAQGGTVFLDEIGDMDLNLQVKLLRVVEDRQVRRIGGSELIDLDVRMIAATNRSLEELIKEGRFREDLYYRLKLINILLPPLRKRRADLPILAAHFVEAANRRFNKKVKGFSEEAQALLAAYNWPGNVRELKNAIERVLILEDTELIGPHHLPPEITGARISSPEGGPLLPGTEELLKGIDYEKVLENIGAHLITQALKVAEGNKTKAARLLNMDRGTLRYNISRLGL